MPARAFYEKEQPMAESGRSAEPILKLRGVSKQFGAVQALADIELDIHAGEVVALASPRWSRSSRASTSRPRAASSSWAGP